MTDKQIILVAKGLVNLVAIFGIIYLAANDKDGWGWLIFLLIIID